MDKNVSLVAFNKRFYFKTANFISLWIADTSNNLQVDIIT